MSFHSERAVLGFFFFILSPVEADVSLYVGAEVISGRSGIWNDKTHLRKQTCFWVDADGSWLRGGESSLNCIKF